MGEYSTPLNDEATVQGDAWLEALRRSDLTVPDVEGIRREVAVGGPLVAIPAAAAVAILGGLAWAGVVIATHWDIGILAWLIGAAVGATIFRLAGPVGVGTRVVGGLFAAGGIMVGKYVIFVHAVKATLGSLLATNGVSISYLDSRQMSIFVHHFGQIVRPIYALWVGLAFFAALRVAGRGSLRPSR